MRIVMKIGSRNCVRRGRARRGVQPHSGDRFAGRDACRVLARWWWGACRVLVGSVTCSSLPVVVIEALEVSGREGSVGNMYW
jgi:hypothetical protein